MNETASKLLGCKAEGKKKKKKKEIGNRRKKKKKKKKGRNKHELYFDKVSKELSINLYLFIELIHLCRMLFVYVPPK